MSNIVSEIRYSLRLLMKKPAFFTFAALILALGIGANTAIFSVVDEVLLRPLQFRDSNQLVMVWEDFSHAGFPENTPAPANFLDWKKRNHVFSDMAATRGNIYAITEDGPPEQVEGSPITANLLPLLGVSPVLGRNFLPEEDQPGGAKVAIISAALWQRRYGADPAILQRRIRLDGEPYQIVGVMPQGFTFPERFDIWVPMALTPEQWNQRGNHYLRVVARLKPGVTLEAASRDMSAIARQLAREYPVENTNVGTVVRSLRDQLTGDTGLGLLVLTGGVGCVLLIACANLAGLLMARAAGRRREWAVRAALGASRMRLIAHGMVESLLLSFAGGALGILMAIWSLPLLRNLIPLALTGWAHPQLNWRVALFAFLLSAISALLFGALPALQSSRIDLNTALQQGGRSATGSGSRIRKVLVVSEVALAMVLLVGAGLFIQTLWKLAHVELGFRPESILTMRTNLPSSSESRYRSFEAQSSFYEQVLEKVNAIPGVVSAGYTTFLPLTNRGGSRGFTIEGQPPPPPGRSNDANHRVISAEYLQTIGVRLRSGRYFSHSDGAGTQPVVIINEAMARQYWPNENPLGHRIKIGSRGPWIAIVGVVEKVRQMGLDVAGRVEMYFPCTQPAATFGYFRPRDLAVRVQRNPLEFVSAVRQAIWSVDRNQPISNVMPMTQLIADELASKDLQVKLLGGFAALSLLLAALGLYALLAYSVTQRTKEIGIRMALGAEKSLVLRKLLREGLQLVMVGLLIGLAGTLLFNHLIARLLYGVTAADPWTFIGASLVLLAVGAVASYYPARRAASIDPMEALRHE